MNSLPKPLNTYYDHAHGIGITYSDHAHRIGITYSDHARRPRLLCNSLLRRHCLLCNSLLLGPAFYVFTQNKTPTTGAKLGSVEKKDGSTVYGDYKKSQKGNSSSCGLFLLLQKLNSMHHVSSSFSQKFQLFTHINHKPICSQFQITKHSP